MILAFDYLVKGAFNYRVDKKGWVGVSQMSTFVHGRWVGTASNVYVDIMCSDEIKNAKFLVGAALHCLIHQNYSPSLTPLFLSVKV